MYPVLDQNVRNARLQTESDFATRGRRHALTMWQRTAKGIRLPKVA